MPASPHVENLEPRQLLSVTVDDGVLTVTGTRRSDLVLLAIYQGRLQVRVNSGTTVFDPDQVERISIRTGRGNDRVYFGAFAGLGFGFPLHEGRLNFARETPIDLPVALDVGAGNDWANLAHGDVRASGGPGDDVINAGDGRNFLDGGDGNDALSGGAGGGTFIGGAGQDAILGGKGNDTLIGGDGGDQLMSGSGTDILRGHDGNDTLDGGDGDGDGQFDILVGGDGDDVFRALDRLDRVRDPGREDLFFGPAGPINRPPDLD